MLTPGQKFYMLTVVCVAEKRIGGYVYKVVCDCGNTRIVQGQKLKASKIKSCGCAKSDLCRQASLRHGRGKDTTGVYITWMEMRRRCNDPNHDRYSGYGGRGVTICKEWEKFENFLSDMGERPEGMSIERVDNNQGYSKSNCKWATPTEQANNRRTSHVLTIHGISRTIAQWSVISGIKQRAINRRVNRHGWDAKRAVFEPINPTTRRQ